MQDTNNKNEVNNKVLTGERALFNVSNLIVNECTFEDGESPLKESSFLKIYKSSFNWKYPLWYCHDVEVSDSRLSETGRAGIWYTDKIKMVDTIIDAPKAFRRCKGLKLENVSFTNASETMWKCTDIMMNSVDVKGDYFAMNSSNIVADNLTIDGNYPFDGAKNVEIRNSKLISKDAFWNAENITVYDSFISGEYLGWNSKNVTFINCTIESLQGLCYIDGLVMKNCKTVNTNLAFEYSTCDVELTSHVDSIKNPSGGSIRALSVGELIMEEDKVNVDATKIIIGNEN